MPQIGLPLVWAAGFTTSLAPKDDRHVGLADLLAAAEVVARRALSLRRWRLGGFGCGRWRLDGHIRQLPLSARAVLMQRDLRP